MNQEPPQNTPEVVPAPKAVRVPMPHSAPYVTYAIIGVTILIYLLQRLTNTFLQYDIPVALFIKSNDLIRSGQLWRLVTPALVHGSLAHIGFNMYAMFSFGTNLERYFGRGRFFLLYVLGAFAGNVASFIMTDLNSLGASTAIFGLLAAEGVFLFQNRKLLEGQFRSAIGNIIFIAVINLFVIGSLPGIDNWGHIGGLLGGLVFTWFAGPLWDVESDLVGGYRLVDHRSTSEMMIGAAVVVFVFGALAAWGIVRP